MPQGDKDINDQIYLTKVQICDGTTSKLHVMRSTTYVESFMVIRKSAQLIVVFCRYLNSIQLTS